MRRLTEVLEFLQTMEGTDGIFGVAVGTLSVVIANTLLSRRITFTAEGYNHAVRMLMARGYSCETALKMATEFYHTQPVASDPRFAHLFGGLVPPENWDQSALQVVYPHAAGMLFDFRGFEALTDLSRLSYVGTAISSYSLLRNFARPWLSATLTLALMFTPRVWKSSIVPETRGPALFLWTLTLDAMCRTMRCGTASQFIYALSCLALTFTRPVPYLPLGAAAAAFVQTIVEGDRVKKKTGAAMLAVAAVSTCVLTFAASQIKATDVRRLIRQAHAKALKARQSADYEKLSWFARLSEALQYDAGPRDQRLMPWYLRAIMLSMTNAGARAVLTVFPVVAGLGIAMRRDDPCAPLLAGATLGSAAGILGNPAPQKASKTILGPLYPVIAAGCALAADVLIESLLWRSS